MLAEYGLPALWSTYHYANVSIQRFRVDRFERVPHPLITRPVGIDLCSERNRFQRPLGALVNNATKHTIDGSSICIRFD